MTEKTKQPDIRDGVAWNRWRRENPGRDADLSGADLSDADLRGADLSDADLRGTILSGADLSGADLSGADLSGACLSGACLRGAYLRGACLRDADLSDVRDAVRLPVGDPRGYDCVAIITNDGTHIAAGCRWLTVAEARVHWGEAYEGDRPIGDRYLAAIDWFEAQL